MAFKYLTILALLAVAVNAGVLPSYYHHPEPAPQVYHPVAVPTTVVKTVTPVNYAHTKPAVVKHDVHYDDHPQYNFNYDVNDEHTGDVHSQTEERDGDVVRGEYSLIDADGYRRVVQYTVDPHSGFNAVVNRIPLDQVKTIVKKVTPVTYVAPTPTIVKQYHAVPQVYHEHH
ncbi:larval cuticle protein A2B-like [Musca vetustissima]|uniref:larval cuticle protein A2B-like n=1 Tax=Musca vetustissima TaxID=27455 RepID=UPI002AB6D117|nr:larval cuticle protein A2B-like [Musca vetustissima]